MQVPPRLGTTLWGHPSLLSQTTVQTSRQSKVVPLQDGSHHYQGHVPVFEEMHGDLFRTGNQNPPQESLGHFIVHLRGGRAGSLHHDHQLFRPQGAPRTALPTSHLQECTTKTPHMQLSPAVGSLSGQQCSLLQRLRQTDSIVGELHSRCVLGGPF